jgi:hypothetical protein
MDDIIWHVMEQTATATVTATVTAPGARAYAIAAVSRKPGCASGQLLLEQQPLANFLHICSLSSLVLLEDRDLLIPRLRSYVDCSESLNEALYIVREVISPYMYMWHRTAPHSAACLPVTSI